MKIIKLAQFERADETARELWNLLLQRVNSHDMAMVVLNRLLSLVEEHADGRGNEHEEGRCSGISCLGLTPVPAC